MSIEPRPVLGRPAQDFGGIKEVAVGPVAHQAGSHVGLHGQDEGIGCYIEDCARKLDSRRIGTEREVSFNESLWYRATGMKEGVGARHGLVTHARGHAAVGRTQHFVDAVPEQLAANPAGVQGVMNIHIAFGEQTNALHRGLPLGAQCQPS